MKAKGIALLIAIILPWSMRASDSTSLAKDYFTSAKFHLENMLDGKEPMSFEDAIYQIENAWWENRIDYSSYKAALDFHTNAIRVLMDDFRDSSKMQVVSDLSGSKEKKLQAYEKLLANYSIYRYMTNTTIWLGQSGVSYRSPSSYSYADPMATTDWTNSQVCNLLNNNTGNCFALAATFKIFSQRLNSDALLCTAPSHIYIRHADEKGTYYNVELSSKTFPGTGTIETITYTPGEATKNNIALRELSLKQSIALCLVYLAKGYEHKFNIKADGFMLDCAESALKYDDRNLNAMLLKAEILEKQLIKQGQNIEQLQSKEGFNEYEQWLTYIYKLGYREMPFEMKNLIIKGWAKDTLVRLSLKNHTPQSLNSKLHATRYASLSWGLFDEEMKTKPFERYGNTVFDTKKQKIVAFLKSDILYNQYNFDPVVFAMNVDPLAYKYPSISPYAFVANNPIKCMDPDGRELVLVGYASDLDGFKTAISKSSQGQIKLEIAKNGVATFSAVGNEKLSDRNQKFLTTLNEVMTNKKATYVQVLGDEGKDRKIAFLGGYQNITHPDVPQAYGSLDYKDMQSMETRTNGDLSVLGFVGHEVWENYEKQILRPNASFKKVHDASIGKQSNIDDVSDLSLRGDLTEGTNGSVNGNVEIKYKDKEGQAKTHSIIVTEGDPKP